MIKPDRRPNPIILRQGMTIGSGSAESDDDFLFDCFVHYSPVDLCTRMQSPGMILAGRTGSGKTAIIRYIERSAEHATVIDPSEMAMNYVSNSDALNFVQAIGADLDLLFQVLWKHVLCIEFIRLRWSIEDEDKSKTIFARISSLFDRDARKRRAIQYLKDWEGKFWITMDQNIKEITENFENKLLSEMGGEIAKFRAGGQYEKRMSEERKSELVVRARKIINADQLMELNGVIDILGSSEFSDRMNKFYILIDKLDERWVDNSIRFRLIRALIESLKAFRKITNLKVLVALRSDILERVLFETSDVAFQREKYEDYFIRLKWTRSDLKQMVDKRIDLLLKRQYSNRTISFEDVFRHKIANKDPFDYILERTQMRPRGVIAFVNECIRESAGQYEIGANHIRRAELQFSRVRRDALEQEWQGVFPSLRVILNILAKLRRALLEVKDVCVKEIVEEMAFNIAALGRFDYDPMFHASRAFVERSGEDPLLLVREAVEILYRVGAIGVKAVTQERFWYSYNDQPLLTSALVTTETKIRIHLMLYGVFGLSDAYRGH